MYADIVKEIKKYGTIKGSCQLSKANKTESVLHNGFNGHKIMHHHIFEIKFGRYQTPPIFAQMMR